MRWLKWLILPIFLACVSCSAGTQIIKLDQENYAHNKELAKATLQTWSFNSGFITCAAVLQIKLPITTAKEAAVVFQSPQISLAVMEMDEIAKRRKVWSDEDFDLGCTLGLRARASAMVTLDILKLIPTLAPYVAGIGF